MTEFERMLEVQELDTRVDQLRYRLTHDVTITELETARAGLAQIEREMSARQAELDAVRAVQRGHERVAEDIDAKIAKENGMLYGGTVTSPKELEALQHEIGTLTRLRTESEDLVIEQMELAEPIEAELQQLSVARSSSSTALEAASAAVTVMEAEVGVELDRVIADRSAAIEGLDATLLATYERIRLDLGGTAVARLATGGKCEGCHLSLARAEYDQIKRAPADSVVNCPECGRILVR